MSREKRSLRAMLLRMVIILAGAVTIIQLGVILLGAGLIRNEIADHQQISMEALSRQGDQYLEETDRLMRLLADTMLDFSPETQAELLAQVRANYSRFTALYLLDETGRVLVEDTDTSTLLDLDLSGERFFRSARDPGRTHFSDPFISLATRQVSVTGAAPIFEGEEFRGMLVGELSLALLQQAIEQAGTGRSDVPFIVDWRGMLVAHPNQAWVQEQRNLGNLRLVQEGLTGKQAFDIFYDDSRRAWFVGSVKPMKGNWIVVTTQPVVVAARSLIVLVVASVLAVGLSHTLFFWAQVHSSRQVTHPVSLLAQKAEALSRGQYEDLPVEQMGNFSEIISLGQSFARMVEAIQERDRFLEQRVADRTQRLKIVASLGERLNAILDPEALLAEVVHQVKGSFGYYFVGVLLVDDEKGELVLKEATGDIKARGVSICLDATQSLVARAARTGKVVNVDDMHQAADWLPHPLLPDTCSEIAVPIIVEDKVIGVLDVQEDEPGAFDASEADMFRSLANQVGVAFHNARLYTGMENLVAKRTAELVVANDALVSELQERKRTEKTLRESEEELRESEARLRQLIEQMPYPIEICRPDGTAVLVNRAFLEMFGVPSADLVIEKYNVFDDAMAMKILGLEEEIRRVYSGETVFIPELILPLEGVLEEYRVQKKEYVAQEVTMFPVFRQSGEIWQVVTIWKDITGQVQARAELVRLQHLLQSVADSMPSALIALDPDGQVLLWNPAARALAGQAADQVLGQLLWEVCPELVRYRKMFERVLGEGQVAHLHKERLAMESGVIYRDVSVFPLATGEVGGLSKGSLYGLTGSSQIEGAVLRLDDVTRRVQLEEMMLQSAKMASIGGLAAGVAHEINNPLGAMMQSAQVLQMALDSRRPRIRERLQACGVDPGGLERYLQERGLADYLEGIRSAGGRAAKIVSDLLSFSRQTSFRAKPHDLNVLVEQTLELAATDYDLKKKYDFRDIEIVREFGPDLPQVVCDGQQIQQVVLNLVRNAAQAMAGEIEVGTLRPKGDRDRDRDRGWRPRLTLRTVCREEVETRNSKLETRSWVRLEVEDNGPGIPEAVQARLFDPFFTTKEVGEGTGLGLWLCWSIVVEHHKGQIWAEPVLGEVEGAAEGPATEACPEPGPDRVQRDSRMSGSRFVIELPIDLEAGGLIDE